MTTIRANAQPPLLKVYDGFSSERLHELLAAFELDRTLGEADEDFCLARIDTIKALLKQRGVDLAGPLPLGGLL